MRSIYILDDDPNLLDVMKIWLPIHGYKVNTFSNSADLFKAIDASTPDVILTDVKLSESKNGISVCSELKQRYHYPNKILLFSATPARVSDLARCGADGFINKPFDLQSTLATLDEAIKYKLS